MTDREHMRHMLKRADEREEKIRCLEAENTILRLLAVSKDVDIAERDAIIRKMFAAMKRMVKLIPEEDGGGAKKTTSKAEK